MTRTGYRSLILNAFGNSAAFVATLAVSLVLAPIVLHALGNARYGAWSFTESFIAYLTLFDLGIAAALVRFTPRCLAKDDRESLNKMYSASLGMFLVGAVVALLIGGVFEWLFLDRCLTTPDHRDEFRWLFRLLVANFALSFPMSVYPAMLDGLGRFSLKGMVRVGVLAARVPLTLHAIRTERPLVALGLVITGCTILENAILAVAVWRLLSGLRFRPRAVDRATIRQIAGYGRDAFLAMLAGRLSFHTDAFVIAPILGPAAITIFAIPARLAEMGKTLLRSATTTLTPAFSALEAADDHARLRATFLSGSRAAWYAAMPLAAGLLILGYPFLLRWVDLPYARDCLPVLLILAAPLPLTIAQSVASRVLYGTGRLGWFARATMAEGVANLVLSLLLIRPFGVVGVAIGTAVPHALFCLAVMVHVCRQLQVHRGDYVRAAVKPIAAIVPAIGVWTVLGSRGIADWPTLFVVAAAGLLVNVAAVAVFERNAWFGLLIGRTGKSLPSHVGSRAAG